MNKTIISFILILLILPICFSFSGVNIDRGTTTSNNYITNNITNITNVTGLNTLQALNGSLIIQNGTITNISVNQSFVQYRVNETCSAGSSIRVINDDGTVTCETDSGGSGTVTSILFQDGLYGGTITTSGVVGLNYTELVNSVGNWSLDKSSYVSLSYLTLWGAGLNNLSLSTVQTYINANGNWTLDKTSYSTTAQANLLYDSFGRSYSNITALQSSNTSLNNNVSNLNNMINTLNSTKAGLSTATCGVGFYAQNVTLSTSGVTTQCMPDISGSGLDFYPNITALQTSNTSIYSYLNGLWLNLSNLQSSNATAFTLLNGISANVSYVNNSLNNLNTTVQSLLTSNTTIFSRLDSLALNVTFVNNSLNNLNITVQSLLTSNTTIFARLSGLSDNVTYVNNSLNNVNSTFRTNDTLLNNMINTLNSSKSGIGTVTCATGTVMQNLTLSSGVPTVQCVTDATGGGGVSDGNKTDITVSASASVWTVNAYAINSSKLNTTNSPSAGQYPAYVSNGQFTWTTPSAGGSEPTPPAYAYYNYWAKTDFESVTAGYTSPWVPTAIASGTSALLPAVRNHPAIANISTSTTASSGYCYQITGATTFTLQNATYTELIFRPTNSTPATLSGNQTTIRFGFQDVFTATTSPVDGVFFNITSNATGGVVNFSAHTINNSVMTQSNLIYQGSAISPSASTNWYRLYIGIINNTQADFRIYNSTSQTLIASYLINATIPTTVGRETSHAVCGYGRGAVATARGIAELDYMSININATLVR